MNLQTLIQNTFSKYAAAESTALLGIARKMLKPGAMHSPAEAHGVINSIANHLHTGGHMPGMTAGESAAHNTKLQDYHKQLTAKFGQPSNLPAIRNNGSNLPAIRNTLQLPAGVGSKPPTPGIVTPSAGRGFNMGMLGVAAGAGLVGYAAAKAKDRQDQWQDNLLSTGSGRG